MTVWAFGLETLWAFDSSEHYLVVLTPVSMTLWASDWWAWPCGPFTQLNLVSLWWECLRRSLPWEPVTDETVSDDIYLVSLWLCWDFLRWSLPCEPVTGETVSDDLYLVSLWLVRLSQTISWEPVTGETVSDDLYLVSMWLWWDYLRWSLPCVPVTLVRLSQMIFTLWACDSGETVSDDLFLVSLWLVRLSQKNFTLWACDSGATVPMTLVRLSQMIFTFWACDSCEISSDDLYLKILWIWWDSLVWSLPCEPVTLVRLHHESLRLVRLSQMIFTLCACDSGEIVSDDLRHSVTLVRLSQMLFILRACAWWDCLRWSLPCEPMTLVRLSQMSFTLWACDWWEFLRWSLFCKLVYGENFSAYMWSDTISSGPTDIGPPNTSHARQTETPDIYEFRFFAFAKS